MNIKEKTAVNIFIENEKYLSKLKPKKTPAAITTSI